MSDLQKHAEGQAQTRRQCLAQAGMRLRGVQESAQGRRRCVHEPRTTRSFRMGLVVALWEDIGAGVEDVGAFFGRGTRQAARAVGTAAVDVGEWIGQAAVDVAGFVEDRLLDVWGWAEENPEWAGAAAGLALCMGGPMCAYIGHGIGEKIGEGGEANEIAAEGIRRTGDVVALAGAVTGLSFLVPAGKAGRQLGQAVEEGRADAQDVEIWASQIEQIAADPAAQQAIAQAADDLGLQADTPEDLEALRRVANDVLGEVEGRVVDRRSPAQPPPPSSSGSRGSIGGGFTFGSSSTAPPSGGGFTF